MHACALGIVLPLPNLYVNMPHGYVRDAKTPVPDFHHSETDIHVHHPRCLRYPCAHADWRYNRLDQHTLIPGHLEGVPKGDGLMGRLLAGFVKTVEEEGMRDGIVSSFGFPSNLHHFDHVIPEYGRGSVALFTIVFRPLLEYSAPPSIY